MLASGMLALLLTGGGPVGASPAPAPAPSSKPLQVTLPGLVTVTVDLPKVNIDLLGGRRSVANASPTSEPTASSAASSSAPAAATPSVTTRSAPARTRGAGAAPSRTGTRSTGETRRRSARAVTVGDDRRAADRPARTGAVRATPSRSAAPRPAAEAFEGMLRTGLPIWLLAGIVAMCGLGTVLVVRTAGRRPSGAHRKQ